METLLNKVIIIASMLEIGFISTDRADILLSDIRNAAYALYADDRITDIEYDNLGDTLLDIRRAYLPKTVI